MSNLLLFDCNYLCRRAMFSVGHLDNGVMFGFLKDMILVCEQFPDHQPVFCFDQGKPKRTELFPGYKAFRRQRNSKWTSDRQEAETQYREQLAALKTKWLRRIGYRNIFSAEGFEADDLIASICLGDSYDNIIVANDRDFLQLLSGTTQMWDVQKRQMLTRQWFRDAYGLEPHRWVDVKSIAGCSSDNIPGVQGVGERTAVKYLRCQLPEKTMTYKRILDSVGMIAANRVLVKLPFPGTPSLKIKPDRLTDDSWFNTMEKLGMDSLGGIPGRRRRRVTKDA